MPAKLIDFICFLVGLIPLIIVGALILILSIGGLILKGKDNDKMD